MTLSPFVTILLVLAVGVAVAFVLDFLRRRQGTAVGESTSQALLDIQAQAATLRKEAEIKAKEIVLQARTEAEKEVRDGRRELQQVERRLTQREEALDKRAEQNEKREAESTKREQALKQQETQIGERQSEMVRIVEETRQKLEEVAAMTRDEAKQILIEQMADAARQDAARRIRMIEEEARAESDRRAKKIVSIAIERMAGDFVAERTVTAVHLPSDEMKGRIIGREGRNIRAIEAATGVDLIVDDTPETVIVSSHNPIRREIARIALERLISDGRIHPGRIEEVVRKAEDEVADNIREAGEKAVLQVGIRKVHPELLKLVGMLKYRYSYAQNVLNHSLETAFIAGAIASELGLDPELARRAGLLHDIGKALTHEVEGSHAIIGGDIARKYGESAKVVNAIAAHHEEVRAETILAPIVDAADALSGARPGARREMLESYVKRLEELERISNSFKGVEKSYAVQAGREIRIMVEPRSVRDDQILSLANDIAKKIETEMAYPGQIKVTVIRETRASEYAR